MMGVTRGIGLPTSRTDWRLMGRTARLVLSNWAYALLAVVTSVVALSMFVFAQNYGFVMDVLGFEFLGWRDKFDILVELYPLVGTTFSTEQSVLLYLVALLTGLNLTMAIYHFREHGLDLQTGSAGTVGTVLGMVGAGCAACGSAVIVGILSAFGISTSLLFLPLDGLEFLIVAAVVLLLSIYWLADGMRGGQINGCPVDL